jgi:hypothetical protein
MAAQVVPHAALDLDILGKAVRHNEADIIAHHLEFCLIADGATRRHSSLSQELHDPIGLTPVLPPLLNPPFLRRSSSQ